MLGVTRGDFASLINGKSRRIKESFSTGISPTLAGGNRTLDKEIADTDRANEYLHAILYVLTEKPAALIVETSGTPRHKSMKTTYVRVETS